MLYGKNRVASQCIIIEYTYTQQKNIPKKHNNKTAVVQGKSRPFFFVNLFGLDFNIKEYDIFVIKKDYIVLHMEFEWAPQSEPLTGP